MLFFLPQCSVSCWLEAWRDDSKMKQYYAMFLHFFSLCTFCSQTQIKPDPVAKKEYFSQAFCESPVDATKPNKKKEDKNKTD